MSRQDTELEGYSKIMKPHETDIREFWSLFSKYIYIKEESS